MPTRWRSLTCMSYHPSREICSRPAAEQVDARRHSSPLPLGPFTLRIYSKVLCRRAYSALDSQSYKLRDVALYSVDQPLCNALMLFSFCFYVAFYFFHTNWLVSSWLCVDLTKVNSTHKSTRHAVNSTHVSSWPRVELTLNQIMGVIIFIGQTTSVSVHWHCFSRLQYSRYPNRPTSSSMIDIYDF